MGLNLHNLLHLLAQQGESLVPQVPLRLSRIQQPHTPIPELPREWLDQHLLS